ncbi:PREDICTED: ninja-family protein Os03g0419100 [Tarenaya hassleriana]|uniref:ninja-family protein Os03g0419100 n=1 Tax=Tarenaya hassleriana TaxID=28532 RepID=UPI00053C3271|nr:PREDICTED: ninja-family protein Os03g0419100 [Tarenaya hassleriana]
MDANSTATRFGEDDEIELELCLSLGGSVRKTENPKPIETEKSAGYGSRNPKPIDCVDGMSKREIHAVRRQEARKKREAKQQQRRGLCRARNGGESLNGVVSVSASGAERDGKRMKTECNGSVNGETKCVDLNLSVEQNQKTAFSGSYPVSRVWGRYPYMVPNLTFANRTMAVKENNVVNGSGSDGVEDNVKPVSNGSPVCSSSAVSDPNYSRRQGGSSSDSVQTKPDQTGVNIGPGETEQSAEISNGSLPETKQTSNTSTQTSVGARENGKPPKPPSHNGNVKSSLLQLARMPCVTTTGNGPEGKVVNGFLHRYSKSEISIVCVCHGRSFSPAEFIRHAGGTEVSNPLRHITVVPSSF